jgi:hypothetical protein
MKIPKTICRFLDICISHIAPAVELYIKNFLVSLPSRISTVLRILRKIIPLNCIVVAQIQEFTAHCLRQTTGCDIG